jgi:hypothetical protein
LVRVTAIPSVSWGKSFGVQSLPDFVHLIGRAEHDAEGFHSFRFARFPNAHMPIPPDAMRDVVIHVLALLAPAKRIITDTAVHAAGGILLRQAAYIPPLAPLMPIRIFIKISFMV